MKDVYEELVLIVPTTVVQDQAVEDWRYSELCRTFIWNKTFLSRMRERVLADSLEEELHALKTLITLR